jgi:hypothetical protein
MFSPILSTNFYQFEQLKKDKFLIGPKQFLVILGMYAYSMYAYAERTKTVLVLSGLWFAFEEFFDEFF